MNEQKQMTPTCSDDAYELYRRWDARAEGVDFRQFATERLMSDCRFDERQASAIVDDIIIPFADEVDGLQREILDDEKPTAVLRDRVNKLLKSDLNDDDKSSRSLFRRLKSKWLSEPSPSCLSRLCGFLDKEKAEEAMRLFGMNQDADSSNEDVSSLAVIDVAYAEALLARGEFVKEMLDELNDIRPGGGSADDALVGLPKCISHALLSDLLSDEECLLKKLFSLHCLVKAIADDREKEMRKVAPLVALESCRVACREVVEAKSAVRGRRLLELEAAMELAAGNHRNGGK